MCNVQLLDLLKPDMQPPACMRESLHDRWVQRCRYGDITGQSIDKCSFKMARDDEVHGWLGASPDGLVQSLGTDYPDDLS